MFSGFPIFPDAFMQEVVVKIIILNLVWIPVHFGWLYAGASIKRLALSNEAQRRINIFMALAMLAVVGLATLSS
jgi:threonine/homoserine/homoserine lactone efflux protein